LEIFSKKHNGAKDTKSHLMVMGTVPGDTRRSKKGGGGKGGAVRKMEAGKGVEGG